MPLYEYECLSCGEYTEAIQRVDDPPLKKCQCGGKLKKLVSAPAFQFKGTGWYVTDYARKDQAKSSAAASSSSESSSTSEKKAGTEKTSKEA